VGENESPLVVAAGVEDDGLDEGGGEFLDLLGEQAVLVEEDLADVREAEGYAAGCSAFAAGACEFGLFSAPRTAQKDAHASGSS
jgi:hypothetical protein